MVKMGSKKHSGFVFVFAFVDFSILCLESGACHETLLSYALSSDFCRQTSRNAGSFQAIFRFLQITTMEKHLFVCVCIYYHNNK